MVLPGGDPSQYLTVNYFSDWLLTQIGLCGSMVASGEKGQQENDHETQDR
jgi:hypothetical protein